MPDTKRFDTGEVELAYSEWPGDSPPVVMLHGISGARAAELAESVRGSHAAYAYDHRGHGDSGRTPGAYTFVNYGRDVVAFLEGVVRQPALLVGHSLGGMAALYAAAHAPHLVRAAFLIDPPLYAPEVPLRDERGPFTAMAEIAGRPMEELIEAGQPPPRAEMLSKLDSEVLWMTVDRRAFAGWDTDAFLRRIECPVVLEHGDRELGSVIYPGEHERAAANLKTGRLLHLPGTGHAPWLVNREAFYAHVQRFVENA
jgi:pimeloyl-ACP methyl ester carboxylesterase